MPAISISHHCFTPQCLPSVSLTIVSLHNACLSISHHYFNTTLHHETFNLIHLIFSPNLESTLLLASCGFSYALCNSLPPHLQSNDFYYVFESNLKTHLFCTAFSITCPCVVSLRFWVNFVDFSVEIVLYYMVHLQLKHNYLFLLTWERTIAWAKQKSTKQHNRQHSWSVSQKCSSSKCCRTNKAEKWEQEYTNWTYHWTN